MAPSCGSSEIVVPSCDSSEIVLPSCGSSHIMVPSCGSSYIVVAADTLWCHLVAAVTLWCHLVAAVTLWCHLVAAVTLWCHRVAAVYFKTGFRLQAWCSISLFFTVYTITLSIKARLCVEVSQSKVMPKHGRVQKGHDHTAVTFRFKFVIYKKWREVIHWDEEAWVYL